MAMVLDVKLRYWICAVQAGEIQRVERVSIDRCERDGDCRCQVSCSGFRESLCLEVRKREDTFLQVSYTWSPLWDPIAQPCSDYVQTHCECFQL